MYGATELVAVISGWLTSMAQAGRSADSVSKAHAALETVIDMARDILQDEPTLADIVFMNHGYLETVGVHDPETHILASYNSFLSFVAEQYGADVDFVSRQGYSPVYLRTLLSVHDGGKVRTAHHKVVIVLTKMLNKQRRDMVSVLLARLEWLRTLERLRDKLRCG